MMKLMRPEQRGDVASYLLSVNALVACITGLYLLYIWLNPFFLEIWGSPFVYPPDPHFSSEGLKVWRMMYRFAHYPVTWCLPIFWIGATFLIQIGLVREKARTFNFYMTSFAIFFTLPVGVHFFTVVRGPSLLHY